MREEIGQEARRPNRCLVRIVYLIFRREEIQPGTLFVRRQIKRLDREDWMYGVDFGPVVLKLLYLGS
ncbi:hypothetical protein OAL27_00880 [Verrucomicrobiales bacterium]|nr:hypothetical protein [Verrucomicrobiales bacterium]